MAISRRHFLGAAAAAAATAAVVRLPFADDIGFAQTTTRPFSPDRPVLLNSNENAYGPSASVRDAASMALTRAQRYPDNEAEAMLARVAAYHNVKPENVILGCGSTEVLKMAANAFVTPAHRLVTASPTFEAIGFYAESDGSSVGLAPLTADYAHDLDHMLRYAGENTGLVYICNPNNPTATLTPRNDIEQFIQRLPGHVYVLIDEAYHHFAVGQPGYTSFLEKPIDDPRVIVARTFSKVYGMAGLRLGYGIAAPKTIAAMRRWRMQDNVNVVAGRCGVVALNDVEAMRLAVHRNEGDRKEFFRQCEARSVKTIPSCTNFAMMDGGRPPKEVIAYFEKNGILIGRDFRFGNWVRVSFGLPGEMAMFWETWDRMKKVST